MRVAITWGRETRWGLWSFAESSSRLFLALMFRKGKVTGKEGKN